jgi:ApaG protein
MDSQYCAITEGIRVEVQPEYLEEHSRPESNYYFFSYRVRITNEGKAETQVLSRHWVITDGNGMVHEVRGPGVVGQKPVIEPGGSFEYSSFCPLSTPTGNMRGWFQVIAGHKKEVEVKIPLFFLRDLRRYH